MTATHLLSLERRDVGARVVLAVTGEVDVSTAPDLRSAIEDVLADGARELWIDLGETTFMDSSGLHVLIDAHHRAEELRIVCPPGNVRRIFALTGLDDRLTLYDA